MSEQRFEGFVGDDHTAVWETLVRWRSEGRSFALLTVVDARGFTPQKHGAHMLVAQDGETFSTIGGGAIEHQAVARARALFEMGSGAELVRKHLTQELGMCCGGEMAVFVEVIETPPRLFVFGAGYIAKPLAALAAGCGFSVTVVDERPEWADVERYPQATVRCESPEGFLRAQGLGAGDYAIVVTHDHGLDQRLVQALLRKPLEFVGMIGSIAKQRKFALRLRARGFSDAQIARLRTPLGASIGAKTPEEIAVSVVSELIAVRRGKAVEKGWVPKHSRADAPKGAHRGQACGNQERDDTSDRDHGAAAGGERGAATERAAVAREAGKRVQDSIERAPAPPRNGHGGTTG